MKSVFKLKFFVSLVLLASFFILVLNGCKKSEVEPDFVAKEILITDFDCPAIAFTGSDTTVVGKWKLMSWVQSSESSITDTVFYADYSCDNITYEFTKDGKLKIVGNHKLHEGEIEFRFGGGVENGNKMAKIYFFIPDFRGDMWRVSLEEEAQMELIYWSSRGPKLQLVRIQ